MPRPTLSLCPLGELPGELDAQGLPLRCSALTAEDLKQYAVVLRVYDLRCAQSTRRE